MSNITKATVTTLDNPTEIIKDEGLLKRVTTIQECNATYNRLSNEGQKVMLRVAYELGQISNEGRYQLTGYKTVAEFANHMFGYKSNMTNKMVRASKLIAANFVNGPESDVTDVFTIFHRVKTNEDFGLTQLFEVMTVSEEVVMNALVDGVISYDTSCAKLREWAKSLKAPTDMDASSSDTSNASDTDSSVNSVSDSDAKSSNDSVSAEKADITKATIKDWKRAFSGLTDKRLLSVFTVMCEEMAARGMTYADMRQIVANCTVNSTDETDDKTTAKKPTGKKTTAKKTTPNTPQVEPTPKTI